VCGGAEAGGGGPIGGGGGYRVWGARTRGEGRALGVRGAH